MRKILIVSTLAAFLYACSGNSGKQETAADNKAADLMNDDAAAKEKKENRGIGKLTHVDIPEKLDEGLAKGGNGIFDLKCSACHRLTNEKLVGPGWKDVTSRRKPEWIMNFATNTDEMLNKDPEAQAMLELCMVRMPNQSLSDDDARKVYEFMRKNDGVK